MLRRSPAHRYAFSEALPEDEDRVLREAFGRFGKHGARDKGLDLTADLSIRKYWILCDCNKVGNRPPLMFPVKKGGIQREDSGHGTAHAPDCCFARDADEQKILVKSYRNSFQSRGTGATFSLAPCRDGALPSPNKRTQHTSTSRSRPGLAQLLCELLTAAGLDKILPSEPTKSDLALQQKRLRQAAEDIKIAPGVSLRPWLALTLGELIQLRKRIAEEKTPWGSQRPHGIFISSFARIDHGALWPNREDLPPVEVEGVISTFGEGEPRTRSPYLVIGLVTMLRGDDHEASIVRAYAHPCVSWDRMMLVDSALERKTRDLLLWCSDIAKKEHDLFVEIRKPLFDLGPEETADPREVCLPDFVVTLTGENIEKSTIVIETMGYGDATYRDRKARMRGLFEVVGQQSSSLQKTPVIEHDPYIEGGVKAANKRLCRDVLRCVADICGRQGKS